MDDIDLEYETIDEHERGILDYIRKNPKETISQISTAMTNRGICVRATTEKKIKNLLERGFIENVKSKPNKFSCLVINDSNRINMIERKLQEYEENIVKTNQYFLRLLNYNLVRISELKDKSDQNADNQFTKLLHFVNDLEYTYREVMKRILEDLFIVINEKVPSKGDKSNFLRKIVELKGQLVYHKWSEDIERSYYNLQIAKIKSFERTIKEDKKLGDYAEEKDLVNKVLTPLKAKIEDFEAGFLTLK